MKAILKSLILLSILQFNAVGQGDEVWMHPNRGQWDDRIEYKVELTHGEMYIGKSGFLFYLSDVKEKMHHHHEKHEETEEFNFQVIKSTFIGSTWNGIVEESVSSEFYRNYILGNDPTEWKSELYSYRSVRMKDYYSGINLLLEGKEGALKYSFELQSHINPSVIRIFYEGYDKLEIDQYGNLIIHNQFGTINEEKPIAWNIIDGKKRNVPVQFQLSNGIVSFYFPEGYDENYELIIDPSLTFSTFTGSTADNWGMSATPDVNANLFGGGTIFSTPSNGYPTTTGAYKSSHSGGTVDIGITKFNETGSALLYSTYLGGNGSETPNSIVSSQNGELFIFGVTSSSNFPMAGLPYDASYNGGPNVSANANGLGFTQGSDLFVARLNATGTALLASTYIGGTGTDGMNITNLQYNYGDQFRGEIILDANNNVFVASTTQSTNFPVVMGFQNALNGSQDAVIFKMPPTLSSLTWSTYMGGAGFETGNSIALSSSGELYVAGGTSSSNMFIVGADLTFDGGLSDGYLARLNGATGALLSGTYIGANEYDQAYFVQLDIDDKVYVYGQSETNLGVSAGKFGVQNSGQFIWKYNSALTAVEWRTMIGAASGHVEISPTAFLVSDCYDIYVSGWGGQLNVQYSQATFSTTNNFPVTVDAYQSNTNGSNFYVAVLGPDATSFKYGTFMGGTSTAYNHVDGGTSRFDKSGRIYHAVCGSCGANITTGFTTTPGVWSNTANSQNCNMACFKFELNKIEAIVSEPQAYVCLPNPVVFNNNSANGNSFFWNFGDGTTSTAVNPSHVYSNAGDYNVTLVVSDTNNCFSTDSVQFIVHIGDFEGGVVLPTAPICPGDSYQFEAYGGASYAWSPAQFLDDPLSPVPIALVDVTTEFTVIISDSCGVDTINVTLPVHNDNVSFPNDVSVCIGSSTQLEAAGNGTFTWSPPTYLDDPASASPICTPDTSIIYTLSIMSVNGCPFQEDIAVTVYYDPPVPVIQDTVAVCIGQSVTISVSGAESYIWSPNSNIIPTIGPTVTVNPMSDMYYYCDFVNSCGSLIDSVFIDVMTTNINAGNDTIICPGESAYLWAAGGVSYLWSPASTVDYPSNSLVTVTPTIPTMYVVQGWDVNGCPGKDSVWVNLYAKPWVKTNPNVYAILGDEIQLNLTSSSGGIYVWSPSEGLSCVNCTNPVTSPDEDYTYYVMFQDANGCKALDSVHIFYDPILYIPNTFTPDGNEYNNLFKAHGGNITSLEIQIFNRWGELVYTINSLNDFWDGTYNGFNCQDGTYVWKAKIVDLKGKETILTGHVNLLR